MNIKQLFCKHVYKIEREDYLYTTTRRISGYVYDKWTTYAICWECIKCGKQNITTQNKPEETKNG